MKEPIEYDKGQLLKNKSVSVLKEKLLVDDVVCYFERDNSNPIYRFGIVKSFSKRGNTELAVINTVRSDFTKLRRERCEVFSLAYESPRIIIISKNYTQIIQKSSFFNTT